MAFNVQNLSGTKAPSCCYSGSPCCETNKPSNDSVFEPQLKTNNSVQKQVSIEDLQRLLQSLNTNQAQV